MVRELHKSNLLLADAAKAARPVVQVQLHDARGEQRTPLPDPATLLRNLGNGRAKPTNR